MRAAQKICDISLYSSAVWPHSNILHRPPGTDVNSAAGGNSMLNVNPFAVVGASLPDGFLECFLVVMAVAVVAGTLFDIIHKGSARYFFDN